MCCCQNFKTQYKNKRCFYLQDKEKTKTDKRVKKKSLVKRGMTINKKMTYYCSYEYKQENLKTYTP